MKILDSDCNTVFLSDLLSTRYPEFSHELIESLRKSEITVKTISGTKDIWVRDFMPLQLSDNKFIQFKYQPSYLKRYPNLRTNPEELPIIQVLQPDRSEIVIDGGNIIKGKGWVIMTQRIFSENPVYEPHVLLTKLEQLFDKRVIIIPEDPLDILGHADGMVRCYNEDCVLINRYQSEDRPLHLNIIKALKDAGLKHIEVPYNPYKNQSAFDARGCYINFLEVNKLLLIPTFGLAEDEEAIDTFTQFFSVTVEAINSEVIARQGGLLNCLTWQVYNKQLNPPQS